MEIITTTYSELAGALRSCNNPKGRRCSSCPVFSRYDHKECKRAVDILAADAIEKLQAENEEGVKHEEH